jgi:glycosyltransferase involved in cell wall biosynthesis
VKVTLLSHDLSSNAAMRAHRLASALEPHVEVELLGPVRKQRFWPALPREPWLHGVPKKRFPEFAASFLELVERADGDVLIAVRPHLASFGAALVAGERRGAPVVLDVDDLDAALAPRAAWGADPSLVDPARPGSALYASLLSRASGAASEITVASAALRRRFGGTIVPHGTDARLFDPAHSDPLEARAAFGFTGPTVVFPGTPRKHKGLTVLADAVAGIPGARLAVLCRNGDLDGSDWARREVLRIPLLPYAELPRLLAAADVVAVPQLDDEPGRYQTPMKVFDAMAMGRPIVATFVSDLPALLDGCARLVAPGDPTALRTAIAELLADRDSAEALGVRARARCLERYSLERVGATLLRVLRRATAGNGAAETEPGGAS